MPAYYNEIEPYAAQWLRNLIAANLIASGDVDERSIVEVKPDDLKGYTQCHFFAGIGGWSYALRLAGWPDDRPVWTGSCPCQSYSTAGAKRGRKDERHLWPVWESLIEECQPPIIFGEQVANAITYGWLDEVFHGLESQTYACAASVLRACGVNKNHERRRLFFVAQLAIGDDCGESRKVQNTDELQKTAGQKMGNAQFRNANLMGTKFILCRDGYKRAAFPEFTLLSRRLPGHMDIERAFGNAIVPQVAAEFIKAAMCPPLTPTAPGG